jgi:hypothetical protein
MARASARLGLTTAAYVFKSNLLHAAIALSRTPLVVVDLDDSFIIPRHNATWLQRSQVYFKRELAVDHWQAFSGQLHRRSPTKSTRRRSSVAKHLHKLRPISMGRAQAIANVVDSVPLAREKSVDIFFAGQVEGSSTQRLLGIDEFMALAEKGISIDIPEGRISRKEFLFRMSRAHLAWSPSGFGWDCHRHYEAPMVGAVPVIDRPTILRHAPLQDGEHCFFYDPERGGLTRTVLAALAAPERLPAMAMAARDHLLTHHTRRALSREILVAGGMVDLVDTAPGSAVA